MRKLISALLLLLLHAQCAWSYSIITDSNLFYSFFTQPHKIIEFNQLKDGTSFAQVHNSLEQNITHLANLDCLGPRKGDHGIKKTTVQPNAFSDEWSFLVAISDRSKDFCRAVMWFDQGISSGSNQIVVIAASGKSKPFVLYTNKGFLGVVPDNSKETVFIFDGFSAIFGFETEFIEATTVHDSDRSYVAKIVP